jgi:hypothetical protein
MCMIGVGKSHDRTAKMTGREEAVEDDGYRR